MTAAASRAVFLDRDGVINRNRDDYVKSWEEFEFLPGALEALQRLAGLDCRVVVVSNQSVIGRGIVTRATVEDIHRRMTDAIVQAGGRIDGIWYCPHRPEEKCGCRKPGDGLLRDAAQALDIELASSIMIGDAQSDIVAAKAAGCRAVLVKTGRGVEHAARMPSSVLEGVYVAGDLAEAVACIARLWQESSMPHEVSRGADHESCPIG